MSKGRKRTMPKEGLDTRMSSSKVNLETRISARISNSLYLAMRMIASSQKMTIEEKIAELCRREVEYISRQKWFIDMIQSGAADDIQPILDLMDRRKQSVVVPETASPFDQMARQYGHEQFGEEQDKGADIE